ncbi:MAG TPA: NAD-dependent succinate-semialdehyde dehydrogenase [Bryobacteraceae bacterium]
MPIATVNPATGQLLQIFEPLTETEIEEKLQRAAQTFPKFRQLSFAQRGTMMNRAAQILEAQKEALGRIMTTEMGKTLASAIAEAAKCATACRYYAEHAEQFMAPETIDTGGDPLGTNQTSVLYQPIGAILAVMPWNFPFWQVFRFIAPNLMAGNVGLLKHASNVPQCALRIEQIMLEAGFPEGAFQTLLVGSRQVDGIVNDHRVAAVTLTGSEGAGIEVGISAAKRIKKVVLELGGSDPFIVMPSANIEKAVSTAVTARIVNNGQSCIAAKRFIVEASIADEFEHRFVERMRALKVGDPMDPATELGPLSSADALDGLHAQVEAAIRSGARLLTGGRRLTLPGDFRPGNFYEPTVLTNISKESPAYSEELFGPVACLYRVKSLDDAINLANDTSFGLGASAWTQDPAERERFVNEINAGMVFINKMVASDPRAPFGGVKHSGYGRELGEHGIREFTNIKTVWIES